MPTFREGMMTFPELRAFTGPQDQLDQLIQWKAGSVIVYRHYYNRTQGEEPKQMQRQFTIELRVDFADAEKLPSLTQVLQQCARNAYATAQLLSDNPKTTQIAIFADDFFSGHEAIKLLADTMQEGLDAIGEQAGSEEISDELREAVRGPI